MVRKNKSPVSTRRLSRLNAVQILYQHEQTETEVGQIIAQYRNYATEIDTNLASFLQPDEPFLQEIVVGVLEHREVIDEEITAYLSSEWRFDRLSLVMRNILRLAVYELKFQPLVPTAVILNEYIEISRDFFGESETAFANGILDTIAQKQRGKTTT